jgi:hypothetical protein
MADGEQSAQADFVTFQPRFQFNRRRKTRHRARDPFPCDMSS